MICCTNNGRFQDAGACATQYEVCTVEGL